MTVGVPYSGKSTWVKEFLEKEAPRKYVVVSTDDIIMSLAKQYDLSYSDIFQDAYLVADLIAKHQLDAAIEERKHIILDKTNLYRSTRTKILTGFPSSYQKIARLFPIPSRDELTRRMAMRKDKIIPQDVIQKFITNYNQFPVQIDEGFSKIELHEKTS